MEFVATESGFEHGMGGASNAAGTADYHYVLFGRQTDAQHRECSGVYFEFDDQIHGGVDRVGAIAVTDDRVSFELRMVRVLSSDAVWRRRSGLVS